MTIDLKSVLLEYHPLLCSNPRNICDLRSQDPDFNSGHGERFYRAFDRAVIRGDFRRTHMKMKLKKG